MWMMMMGIKRRQRSRVGVELECGLDSAVKGVVPNAVLFFAFTPSP